MEEIKQTIQKLKEQLQEAQLNAKDRKAEAKDIVKLGIVVLSFLSITIVNLVNMTKLIYYNRNVGLLWESGIIALLFFILAFGVLVTFYKAHLK